MIARRFIYARVLSPIVLMHISLSVTLYMQYRSRQGTKCSRHVGMHAACVDRSS